MEKNPSASTMQAWKELKRDGYPGGVNMKQATLDKP